MDIAIIPVWNTTRPHTFLVITLTEKLIKTGFVWQHEMEAVNILSSPFIYSYKLDKLDSVLIAVIDLTDIEIIPQCACIMDAMILKRDV